MIRSSKNFVRDPFSLDGEKARMRGSSAGFTLFESLTVVMMISVLTVMSFTAIPALRAHQELVADTEKIRESILDAKQRTLNQVRPEACLESLGLDANDPDSALCSDVGIAIRSGEIIEFSNTYTSGSEETYTYNSDQGGVPNHDYIIARSKLVTTTPNTSLLFISVPPSILLYNNGDALTGNNSETITLTSTNGSKRVLTVHSFGTIDIK